MGLTRIEGSSTLLLALLSPVQDAIQAGKHNNTFQALVQNALYQLVYWRNNTNSLVRAWGKV